jgi:hypothetical protein
VLPHLAQWRINIHNLHAAFGYSLSANAATFTDASVNRTSLLWDFGDGQTSALPNPTHTYASTGTYAVRQYAYAGGCVDSTMLLLEVLSTVASPDAHRLGITCYPNPATRYLEVANAQGESLGYRIFDMAGVAVQAGSIAGHATRIEIAALARGIYCLQIADGQGAQFRWKFVKQGE